MNKIDANIAKTLGLAPSMVYKLRKGDRFPSFKTMKKIEEKMNWSINEQYNARIQGTYSEAFSEAANSIVEQ